MGPHCPPSFSPAVGLALRAWPEGVPLPRVLLVHCLTGEMVDPRSWGQEAWAWGPMVETALPWTLTPGVSFPRRPSGLLSCLSGSEALSISCPFPGDHECSRPTAYWHSVYGVTCLTHFPSCGGLVSTHRFWGSGDSVGVPAHTAPVVQVSRCQGLWTALVSGSECWWLGGNRAILSPSSCGIHQAWVCVRPAVGIGGWHSEPSCGELVE